MNKFEPVIQDGKYSARVWSQFGLPVEEREHVLGTWDNGTFIPYSKLQAKREQAIRRGFAWITKSQGESGARFDYCMDGAEDQFKLAKEYLKVARKIQLLANERSRDDIASGRWIDKYI